MELCMKLCMNFAGIVYTCSLLTRLQPGNGAGEFQFPEHLGEQTERLANRMLLIALLPCQEVFLSG